VSAIGTSDAILTVDRDIRRIVQSGDASYFRQDINVTMSGFDRTKTADANLALFIFRGSTQVANGGTFAANGDDALGTISTNTTQMETVMSGVHEGSIRAFAMRLYDGLTEEKISEGTFSLRGTGTEYSDDGGATPVTPVSGSTVIWGKLAYYGGETYGLNEDDGLWYPVSFRGPGAAIHLNLGETGIVIPT